MARGWVWLLRFQVGVVYAFAGLAKLHGDWVGRGLPLRLWLPARADLPLVGPLLAEPATAHVLSLAGAAFDLAVVPLLLWRRTRRVAWLVVVAFHVTTWALFPIGVFPWLMIGASTVFFEPDWPRRARTRLAAASARLPGSRGGGRTIAVPRPRSPSSPVRTRLAWVAAAAWVAMQLALPLRHLAYPGDHRWTGQGYRFAWNVLLTEKAGSVAFVVREPASGRTWVADPTELYTPTQLRAMATEPDLIHQAALAIAARGAVPWPRGRGPRRRVGFARRPARSPLDRPHGRPRGRAPRPLVRPVDPPAPLTWGQAAAAAWVTEAREKWPTMRWRAEPFGWQPKRVAV